TGNATEHRCAGVMDITAYQLMTENGLHSGGGDAPQRETIAGSETRRGHAQRIVEGFFDVLVESHAANRFHDLTHIDEIIVTIDISAGGQQFTLHDPEVHRIAPVIAQIEVFRHPDVMERVGPHRKDTGHRVLLFATVHHFLIEHYIGHKPRLMQQDIPDLEG